MNNNIDEKLDLLSVLKEDSENHKHNKPSKKEYHTTKEEEAVLTKIRSKKRMRTYRKGIYLLSFVTEIIALVYLLYIVLKGDHLLNQPHLLIQSGVFFLLVSFYNIGIFIKNKGKEIFQTLLLLCFSGFLLFELLVSAGHISVPTLKTIGDFTEANVNEVIKWASAHHVTLEQTYEYSDSIESNYVISQSLPADTLVKDVKKLEVTVSNGPNLESIVNIPNMMGWHVDDVVQKIEDQKLSNVQIIYEFHDTISRDILFEQSKSGDIRRNEELVLKFSLGTEADLKPVELIDLIGKKEFDATLWLKRNGIFYQITYEFSDTVERGKVISSDPVKGTMINQKETTVQLIISKGPKIIVPDLMSMSLDDIIEWASKNNISLSYETEYSDTIASGKIIRISVKKGDTLEVGNRVYIVTSIGALMMPAYEDGDLTALRTFAMEHNITLTVNEEFSDTIEKGKFIEINYKPKDIIKSGSEIQVKVSLGKSTTIPNFIGMTKTSADNACNSNGLDCTFSYVYSSKTKGIIISQNKDAGSNVVNGTNIVLTVSNGPKPASNSGSSNSSGSSNNSGNNNSGSNGNTEVPVTPPTPVCEAKTYTIDRGLTNIFREYTGFSSVSAQLYSFFANNYPNVKINVEGVDGGDAISGSYIGGIGPGSVITSCNTTAYTIQIAK